MLSSHGNKQVIHLKLLESAESYPLLIEGEGS